MHWKQYADIWGFKTDRNDEGVMRELAEDRMYPLILVIYVLTRICRCQAPDVVPGRLIDALTAI
jgi:hypothetical protein